ncbi:MAG: phasin family protein [Rhodospirillaceae bacterium]|nr:phasin family protein [Rhodospirillaceae bacterium]
MAKQAMPMWDMDLSKMFSEMKLPTVDMDAVMSAQRKNIEALTAANKLAFEGMQAVARRQADVMRQMMEEMSGMISDMMSTGSPEEKVARQADMAKKTFERILANMKELAEMLSKSNTEAADVINGRISESLEELKAMAHKK